MKFIRCKQVLFALTATLASLALCIPSVAAPPEEHEYILSFESVEARDAALETINCTTLDLYNHIFAGMAVRSSNRAALASLDGLLSMEEVREYKLTETESTEMSGAAVDDEETLSRRGEGMVIAVLDSAFDVTHPAFALSDESHLMLDCETVSLLIDSHMNVANYYRIHPDKSPYYSAKLPFVFDYYDLDDDVSGSSTHGTHVAGIIGANKKGDPEGGFDGVAPEAQLLLMKIGNGGSYVNDRAIFSAFDDAISLGADVINMSFGTAAGFDSLALSSINYGYLFSTADALGIHVVCASGNEGQVGAGGNFAVDLPLATNPDTGLVAEPASIKTTVAVAAIESEWLSVGYSLETEEGERILFTESDSEQSFGETLAGNRYSLVKLNGIGEEADYEGISLPDQAILLIERGVISFEEKVERAASHGALAVIVSDNIEGEAFAMAVGDAPIPAVSVTKADGAKLAECRSIAVMFDSTPQKNERAGQPAAFSSGGATPALKLKPELSAPGTYIRSTLPGGKYGSMSGTSMAAPYVSGALALAKQTWGEEAKVRLMATANVLCDERSVEYSPRKQGAGEVNLASALSCPLLMTSQSGSGKLELGCLTGSHFELTLLLTNPTEEAIIGKLSASLLSDDSIFESGHAFISGTSALTGAVIRLEDSRNLNRHHRAFDGGIELTLEAGETMELTLTVSPSKAELASLERIFTNGFFLEGYLYFEYEEQTLSLPYMGFYGDWNALPVIDGTDYSVEEGFYPQYAITCVVAGNERAFVRLGESSGKVSFSPDGNGMGDTLGFLLNPLRNADEYGYRIYDAEGRFICGNEDLGKLTKATLGETLEGTAEELLWDGTDPNNEHYTYPDGDYRLVLFIRPDAHADRVQTVTLDFVIDTVKPTLESYRFIEKEGRRLLEISVSDNRALSYVTLYQTGEGAFSQMISSPESTVRFDVTDLEGKIWLDIADLAMNITVEKINL